jgi:hypothetical protein
VSAVVKDPIAAAQRMRRGEGLGENPQLVILALLAHLEAVEQIRQAAPGEIVSLPPTITSNDVARIRALPATQTRETILAQLLAVIPEIAHGRETHRLWANAPAESYARNPDIGDKAFHQRCMAEYDARLKAINDAIAYLSRDHRDALFSRVRYAVQVPYVPEDLPNPEGYEAFDYHRFGALPFLPVAGMWIDCGDGDCREVDDVYWSGGELTVHFVEQESEYSHATMLERGWSLE